MSIKKKGRCVDLKVSATINGGDEKDARTDKCKVIGPTDGVNIRVGVFFDGTENNMYNTEARLDYEKKANQYDPYVLQQQFRLKKAINTTDFFDATDLFDGSKKKPYDAIKAAVYEKRKNEGLSGKKASGKDISESYYNDYSNVARLFQNYQTGIAGDQVMGRIYVEGIGTKRNMSDETAGKAFGAGETGIPERVKEACQDLALKIKELANDKIVMSLKIDVFGFSRGAAAARHFVNEINKQEESRYLANTYFHQDEFGELGKSLKEKNVKMESRPEVVFAGLFDTVSSYIGTEALNLDISKAKEVLHLTAMDERRATFPSTDVKSKGDKYEKAIPGVHSDIGGGYNTDVNERGKIIFEGDDKEIKQEIEYLLSQGWYSDRNQLNDFTRPIMKIRHKEKSKGVETVREGHIEVVTKKVSNKYCFIPLMLMHQKADMVMKGMFKGEIKTKFPEPTEEVLKYTYDQLKAYVIDNTRGPMKFYTAKELGIDDMATLRKDYERDSLYKQKIEDHYALKELRQEYFHTSHDFSDASTDTMFFDPFSPSINDKPSREIIKG